jgi:hypothetical protein
MQKQDQPQGETKKKQEKEKTGKTKVHDKDP